MMEQQQPRRRHRRDSGIYVYRRHSVVRHWHGGILFTVGSAYQQHRKPGSGRLTTVKVGHLCPVCGFHPNDTAKDMTRQALEACGR